MWQYVIINGVHISVCVCVCYKQHRWRGDGEEVLLSVYESSVNYSNNFFLGIQTHTDSHFRGHVTLADCAHTIPLVTCNSINPRCTVKMAVRIQQCTSRTRLWHCIWSWDKRLVIKSAGDSKDCSQLLTNWLFTSLEPCNYLSKLKWDKD